MTSSPSETDATTDPLNEYASNVAEVLGGDAEIVFGTVKIKVQSDDWVEAHRKAKTELGLVFFSWLSAVDWTNEVAVGDAPSDEVEERFEVLCTLSDLGEGRRVTLSTNLDKASPSIASLVEVFAGANWHEREAAEMFGIEFVGHPNPATLYLPDGFIGNPLLKSYPLLSREVKPWPGTVDVEALPEAPSAENPEA